MYCVLYQFFERYSVTDYNTRLFLQISISVTMADIVGGDTISELMNAFSKFDTDHDGLIGTPELKNVLRFLGHNPTDAELQELAYAMDTNESGTIDLPEFLQAMAKSKADEDAEEDIREAFKVDLIVILIMSISTIKPVINDAVNAIGKC